LAVAVTPKAADPRAIVAFDVDGTLTWTDTMSLFLRYIGGDRFKSAIPDLATRALGVQAGLVERESLKMRALARFLGGWSVADADAAARDFVTDILPSVLRDDAMARLRSHVAEGHRVILVSAAPALYLRPWAQFLEIEVVATRLLVQQNRLAGRLAGPNCRGEEKVRRLRAYTGVNGVIHSAYGDSEGDRELLAAARTKYEKRFKDRPRFWMKWLREYYLGDRPAWARRLVDDRSTKGARK